MVAMYSYHTYFAIKYTNINVSYVGYSDKHFNVVVNGTRMIHEVIMQLERDYADELRD